MTYLKKILEDTQREKNTYLMMLEIGQSGENSLRDYYNLSHSQFDECKRENSLELKLEVRCEHP
jgi:hypothetical protein